MDSTATAVAFRGRSGPRVGDSQRVSQAALQAELVRGAMVRNTQSISPMPDPLKPAPLLGLVELAALAVVAVIGELVKRFAQLWGSNNSRAKRESITERYAFFRVSSPNGLSAWFSTANLYPIAISLVTTSPAQSIRWPGAVKWTLAGFSGSGNKVSYQIWNNPPGGYFGLIYELAGEGFPGAVLTGPDIQYEFANTQNASVALATWGGRINATPGQPVDANSAAEYASDPVPFVPKTAATTFDRLPPVPAAAAPVAQTAPLQQAQTPTTEGVQVVPVVTPSPALVTTAQTTRANFYMPDRLPAPLAPPATKTRTTTGAGTVVAPAALPIPQTSTDQRVYGSQVITSIGVRPDVVAIAEEVGRMEQKMGRLLGNMDQTPDWLDGAIGPLLNALREALLDALVVDVPATVYDFESPCDVDANGDPVVLEQAIAAADYQPAIVARLDAIAAAMGILKGWKQPMCRTSPPRSNVTVTAFEFNPEA